MRIGIFGGTFDPPHLGHLILAAEAKHQLELDKVLWVLTPFPPHKRGQSITPLADRLDMLLQAIADDTSFELSRVEIDRPGPHYALDTVKLLREAYAGVELTYLMGGDSLRDLTTWHRPEEFVAACDWLGVMCRPGAHPEVHDLEALIPGISKKVKFVEAPEIGISSSELRQRIAQGRSYRYYLPKPVYQLIRERLLYQE
ncbi:MAG: nicotinate-nucleotide adenylyltransferase [Anaerolineales bacterium]|nr:nicotinate-nucleotide adenylyltransferase [Anaerolineales bacterium]